MTRRIELDPEFLELLAETRTRLERMIKVQAMQPDPSLIPGPIEVTPVATVDYRVPKVIDPELLIELTPEESVRNYIDRRGLYPHLPSYYQSQVIGLSEASSPKPK